MPNPASVLTITLFCPGVLTNPLNASGWTWRQRSRWAADWKAKTLAVWLHAGRPTLPAPATFTFDGYVRRLFDDDNFPGCVKPVRDMAVRLICDTDDGPASGHVFKYHQRTGPHPERGVLIAVTPR